MLKPAISVDKFTLPIWLLEWIGRNLRFLNLQVPFLENPWQILPVPLASLGRSRNCSLPCSHLKALFELSGSAAAVVGVKDRFGGCRMNTNK